MKTSIEIKDTLLQRAKGLALAQGSSLEAVVEMALRRYLEQSREPPGPFKLRRYTISGRGLQPGLDENDWSAIRALCYDRREG